MPRPNPSSDSVPRLSSGGDIEQTIRDLYAASARGEIDAVVAAHDPKAVWELPPSAPFGGVLMGSGPLGEYTASLYTQLGGGLQSELETVDVAGDRALVRGWFVIDTTRVRFADMWQLRDGQIVRRVLATDTATAFAKLSGMLDGADA